MQQRVRTRKADLATAIKVTSSTESLIKAFLQHVIMVTTLPSPACPRSPDTLPTPASTYNMRSSPCWLHSARDSPLNAPTHVSHWHGSPVPRSGLTDRLSPSF